MFVGDLKVMLGGYRLTVTNPGTDDVEGVRLGEFRFSRGSQVLEQLGPGLDLSSANDSAHLCS